MLSKALDPLVLNCGDLRALVFPVSFPFKILRLLDFSGLNCRRDHVAIFSSVLRIHCVPWIHGVIMVTSSIKARQAGCLVSSSAFGPLYCIAPAFSNRFIAAMNRATEIVHPAMMPFSSLCHLVVTRSAVNLIRKAPMCAITSSITSDGTWY